MHNTLVMLTQQTMTETHHGGRTNESKDNSQLILGVHRINNPDGIITIPENLPRNFLASQLLEGIVIASKSFYDERPVHDIATELAKKYDGSGGCSILGEYTSVEFATGTKQRFFEEYFK